MEATTQVRSALLQETERRLRTALLSRGSVLAEMNHNVRQKSLHEG